MTDVLFLFRVVDIKSVNKTNKYEVEDIEKKNHLNKNGQIGLRSSLSLERKSS